MKNSKAALINIFIMVELVIYNNKGVKQLINLQRIVTQL